MTHKNKIAKIRLLDEVTAVVIGLTADHFDILYKKYSIPAPNHFFNPLFKLGRWDGKIHFMKENGRTYAYLLEEILPRLVSMGYNVDIEDLRAPALTAPALVKADIFAHTPHPDTGRPTMLRHYQVDGINALVEAGFGLIKASTGAGKTILCAALCATYDTVDVKTLTIVPSQDLISQTKKVYDFYGLDVGEYSGTIKDLDHSHVVSTWQALQNNPKVVELFQMVLVDECLAGDTQITMSDGTRKCIKDVAPGDVVTTYNERENRFEPGIVIRQHQNLLKSSSEKMYQLLFDNGRAIEVTGNHNILTSTGYVRADELTSDHEVISVDGES